MNHRLTPMQGAILRFIKDYGPCTDEDIDAGVLLDVHGLSYNGGGWEETMEKAAGWISLMELLRINSIIGTGCRETDAEGRPVDHLPETCLAEERESRAWISDAFQELEEGARAIELIKYMARSAWRTRYGSAAGQVMDLRIDDWIGWTCDLYPDV